MAVDFRTIQDEPMSRLRNVKLNLSLSRYIVNKPGLVGCNIVGTQQSGKSTYALMVLYELFQGDIEQVFNHIVFTIKDLTTLLNNAIKNRKRLICVVWDDSSVHGSAAQYNTNRKLVQYLSAMGDTMGIATKGIILTSPSGDIIKAFRNYNFYKVQIGLGRHKYDRVASGYEFGMSPFGQKWGRISFKDTYDVRLPFYDRYYKLRERLSLNTLSDVESFINIDPRTNSARPKQTTTEKILEMKRDFEAGIYKDLTFKDVCIANKIKYGSARTILSQQVR